MCDAFNEGGPRPRPSHLYIVRHVHGRRRSGHSPQQGHVSARRCHVSDHRGVNEQDHVGLRSFGCPRSPAQTTSWRSQAVTFCSVHLHNVVVKKRDVPTPLLQRLHAHMVRLDVDLVGGDFNISVNGPVADVFNDPEFTAPGSSPLWGAGIKGANADCTGFVCMPRRPFHCRVQHFSETT